MEPTPIACRLTPDEVTAQLGEWERLRSSATSVVPVAGGWSMRFPTGLADEVADLARREAACCSFLDLDTTVDGDSVRLDITSSHDEAGGVIDLLVGRGGSEGDSAAG